MHLLVIDHAKTEMMPPGQVATGWSLGSDLFAISRDFAYQFSQQDSFLEKHLLDARQLKTLQNK